MCTQWATILALLLVAMHIQAPIAPLQATVAHMLAHIKTPAIAEINAVTGEPVPPGIIPEGVSAVDSLEVALLSGVTPAPLLFPYAMGSTSVSVFETFIRVVGGFLGAYDLTGNVTYLAAAVEVAWELDGAFSAGPVPFPRWNLRERHGEEMPWFPAGCTSVADAGTPFFELLWLAKRTKVAHFRKRGEELIRALGAHTWVRIGSGTPCTNEMYTPGAGGDSWFEMLIKTGRRPELVSRFLAHQRWETMTPHTPGGHLLCIWPMYVSAPQLERQCVQMATEGCHMEPEAVEMMRALKYDMTAAAAAFSTCKRRYGFGAPAQASWAIAETARYIYANNTCETGTLSTEAHCMRENIFMRRPRKATNKRAGGTT